MDVKEKKMNTNHCFNQKGQSILEFLFFLPLVIGIFFVIFLTNNAIQISIVNQKYIRAQTHFINLNSPVYPRLELRENLTISGSNMLIAGVSGNVNETSGDTYLPEAALQRIIRPGVRKIGSEDPQIEPLDRGIVRVRSTLALCTQPNFVLNGNGEIQTLTSASFSEGIKFDYCRSAEDE